MSPLIESIFKQIGSVKKDVPKTSVPKTDAELREIACLFIAKRSEIKRRELLALMRHYGVTDVIQLDVIMSKLLDEGKVTKLGDGKKGILGKGAVRYKL